MKNCSHQRLNFIHYENGSFLCPECKKEIPETISLKIIEVRELSGLKRSLGNIELSYRAPNIKNISENLKEMRENNLKQEALNIQKETLKSNQEHLKQNTRHQNITRILSIVAIVISSIPFVSIFLKNILSN